MSAGGGPTVTFSGGPGGSQGSGVQNAQILTPDYFLLMQRNPFLTLDLFTNDSAEAKLQQEIKALLGNAHKSYSKLRNLNTIDADEVTALKTKLDSEIPEIIKQFEEMAKIVHDALQELAAKRPEPANLPTRVLTRGNLIDGITMVSLYDVKRRLTQCLDRAEKFVAEKSEGYTPPEPTSPRAGLS
jgi:hypothetical protein